MDLPITPEPAVQPPPGVETFAKTACRLEYKYLVPKSQLDNIRQALKPWVCLDRFCEEREDNQYTVRSIYYDNRRFGCYQEKLEGFRLKKKFRIRGYNLPEPGSMVFLEIKRKQLDYIDKSRAPVPWDRVADVFSGYGMNSTDPPFARCSARAEAASRFLYNYHRKKLLPTVLVTYEREAFCSRFDPTLRITLDRNVRSRLYPALDSLYQDRHSKFLIPGHFVFEVKFHRGLPRWLRTLATRFELQRLAVSKYAIGIDSQRVEKKFLRGIAHTVEFPEAPGPLERRRLDKWVDRVLISAATEQPPSGDRE